MSKDEFTVELKGEDVRRYICLENDFRLHGEFDFNYIITEAAALGLHIVNKELLLQVESSGRLQYFPFNLEMRKNFDWYSLRARIQKEELRSCETETYWTTLKIREENILGHCLPIYKKLRTKAQNQEYFPDIEDVFLYGLKTLDDLYLVNSLGFRTNTILNLDGLVAQKLKPNMELMKALEIVREKESRLLYEIEKAGEYSGRTPKNRIQEFTD